MQHSNRATSFFKVASFSRLLVRQNTGPSVQSAHRIIRTRSFRAQAWPLDNKLGRVSYIDAP